MSKSISQLDTEAVAHTTDLFEVAVADAQSATGYASGKMSAEVIAEGMLNNFTYPTAMPNMQNKTITGAINQMLANFAPVYDATATYSKDDVVTYNGQLYKANQDISVAEAWDSTHWTAIVVKQISGANQHDYSTTEQVVGTWLGETLYEKTYHISNPVSESSIPLNIANIDKVVEIDGVWQRTDDSTYNWWYNINAVNERTMSTAYEVLVRPRLNDNSLYVFIGDEYTNDCKTIITTIRYTKTTS